MTAHPLLRRCTVGALAAALTAFAPAALAPAAHAATVTAAPGLVPAYTATSADQRIASKLTARATTAKFGTRFTGAVVDAASGRTVWTRNGSTALMPASTTKLVTATDALAVFGPTYRFTTRVKRGYQADQVILVGSGDPAFSATQLGALARTTATAMKAKKQLKVRVYADDSLFAAPSLATGWKSSYVPAETPWLRALVVDRRQRADTTLDAANLFAAKLRANGLTVTRIGRGKATSKDPVLASSAGQTVSQLVSTMLLNSDNEHAEALHRLVGIRLGYGKTWAAAKAAQKSRLTKEGLTATALYDGSGLSRSDRLSSLQLARIVTNVFEPGNATTLAVLRGGSALPVSGKTGTLRAAYGRFTATTSRCAVGKVHAKTGTLSDAVALSGWTVGTDGRVKAFAFVVNGKAGTMALKQNLDMLAATVTGCY